ncbi:MAG: D-tyrosyl-tRNA(Tyr) deacylase [Bacilli bacterium]|nr:D-tyrosyl-tRNA(Tyr) deacylase [Bacilli bacterium]
MKVVVQKCLNASVLIDNREKRSIDKGYVVLLGIRVDDNESDIDYIVKKVKNLRIFEDENYKLNLSIDDVSGSILLISQFTLYGDTRKGNRPSFVDAMKGEEAEKLYNSFISKLKETNIPFKTGEFGTDMKVSLVNDGPTTIIIDSKEK